MMDADWFLIMWQNGPRGQDFFRVHIYEERMWILYISHIIDTISTLRALLKHIKKAFLPRNIMPFKCIIKNYFKETQQLSY